MDSTLTAGPGLAAASQRQSSLTATISSWPWGQHTVLASCHSYLCCSACGSANRVSTAL